MIMLADMIVRWGAGLGMLTKGLMAGTWVDHLVAIKAVHRVVTAPLFSDYMCAYKCTVYEYMKHLVLCSPSNFKNFSH